MPSDRSAAPLSFFSRFAARFSSGVRFASFLVSFFLSMPLLMHRLLFSSG